MKRILYILSLAFIGLIVGCNTSYEEPIEFSDVTWYADQFGKNPFNVGVGGYFSISDLSHNTISHKWIVEDGAGVHFLEGKITPADSVYNQFIKPGTVSENATVHLLFTKPGLQKLRLYNTYKHKVKYPGLTSLEAKFENGVWVIDTTFVVDVYAKLKPAYKVFQDGVEITPNANPLIKDTIYVMAGTKLKYMIDDEKEEGRPDTYHWNLNGGKPSMSSEKEIEIQYNRMGIYNTSLTISRVARTLPPGSAYAQLPYVIKVIRSTLDFVVDRTSGTELEDETITMQFNGELKSSTIEGKESKFRVRVYNSVFTSGYKDIPVKKLAINPDDNTALNITVDGAIYNTDMIYVSCTNAGIESVDNRILKNFTNVPIKMLYKNTLDMNVYGFENGGIGWYSDPSKPHLKEFSIEKPRTGTYSLKIGPNDKGVVQLLSGEPDGKLNFETGGKNYVMKTYVWIDPSTTSKLMKLILSGDVDWKMIDIDITALPREQWVEVSGRFTDVAKQTGRIIIQVEAEENVQYGGKMIMYMDDLYLAEEESRPAI